MEVWKRRKLWRQRPLREYFSKSDMGRFNSKNHRFSILFGDKFIYSEHRVNFKKSDVKTLIELSREKSLCQSRDVTGHCLDLVSYLGVTEEDVCNILPLYLLDWYDLENDRYYEIFDEDLQQICFHHPSKFVRPILCFLEDEAENHWFDRYCKKERGIGTANSHLFDHSTPSLMYEVIEAVFLSDWYSENEEQSVIDLMDNIFKTVVKRFNRLITNYDKDNPYPDEICGILVKYVKCVKVANMMEFIKRIYDTKPGFDEFCEIHFSDLVGEIGCKYVPKELQQMCECGCKFSVSECRTLYNNRIRRITSEFSEKAIKKFMEEDKFQEAVSTLNILMILSFRGEVFFNGSIEYESTPFRREENQRMKKLIQLRSVVYHKWKKPKLSLIDMSSLLYYLCLGDDDNLLSMYRIATRSKIREKMIKEFEVKYPNFMDDKRSYDSIISPPTNNNFFFKNVIIGMKSREIQRIRHFSARDNQFGPKNVIYIPKMDCIFFTIGNFIFGKYQASKKFFLEFNPELINVRGLMVKGPFLMFYTLNEHPHFPRQFKSVLYVYELWGKKKKRSGEMHNEPKYLRIVKLFDDGVETLKGIDIFPLENEKKLVVMCWRGYELIVEVFDPYKKKNIDKKALLVHKEQNNINFNFSRANAYGYKYQKALFHKQRSSIFVSCGGSLDISSCKAIIEYSFNIRVMVDDVHYPQLTIKRTYYFGTNFNQFFISQKYFVLVGVKRTKKRSEKDEIRIVSISENTSYNNSSSLISEESSTSNKNNLNQFDDRQMSYYGYTICGRFSLTNSFDSKKVVKKGRFLFCFEDLSYRIGDNDKKDNPHKRKEKMIRVFDLGGNNISLLTSCDQNKSGDKNSINNDVKKKKKKKIFEILGPKRLEEMVLNEEYICGIGFSNSRCDKNMMIIHVFSYSERTLHFSTRTFELEFKMIEEQVSRKEEEEEIFMFPKNLMIMDKNRKSKKCSFCGKVKMKGMKRCSVCLTAYYCSRKCQKGDWKTHKRICNGM